MISIGSCKYIKEEVKKLKIVIVDAGTNLSPVALNLSVIANVYAYFEVYVTNLQICHSHKVIIRKNKPGVK